MTPQESIVLPMKLSDGTVVLAEIQRFDREEEVSWKDYDFSEVSNSLKALVNDVVTPLMEFSCEKITLEINVGLAIKEGKLTSLFVSGGVSSSITLTLVLKRPGTEKPE